MMECITDPKLQKLLELVEIDKRAMDKDALLFLLNSKEGRWFLMRIFDKTDIFGSSFTADGLTNAYMEGRRSIGINLLSEIKELGKDGLKLKQQAETEYADLIADSADMKRKLIESMKENGYG